jgi:hypothetical protein
MTAGVRPSRPIPGLARNLIFAGADFSFNLIEP